MYTSSRFFMHAVRFLPSRCRSSNSAPSQAFPPFLGLSHFLLFSHIKSLVIPPAGKGPFPRDYRLHKTGICILTDHFTITTGHSAYCEIFMLTLPISSSASMPIPLLPSTIISASAVLAYSKILSAGSISTIRR